MNTPPEQLLQSIASVRMSGRERQSVRHLLAAHAQFGAPRRSVAAFFTRHAVAAAALGTLLLIAATGVAAQHAQPGDFLYAVKTDVNDRIALATETDELERLDRELAQLDRMFAEEDLAFARELTAADDELAEPDSTSDGTGSDSATGSSFDDLEQELQEMEREFQEESEALEREFSL